MTVLLLQIVYGAEVKRVFAMQRRAEAQLVAVDVSMVEENRKEFAQIASAAASAAVELADALRNKAAEQALPMKRDALLQLADALEKQAKDVMDRANELLRLPGDKVEEPAICCAISSDSSSKGRQQKLDDALTKLKKTMKVRMRLCCCQKSLTVSPSFPGLPGAAAGGLRVGAQRAKVDAGGHHAAAGAALDDGSGGQEAGH